MAKTWLKIDAVGMKDNKRMIRNTNTITPSTTYRATKEVPNGGSFLWKKAERDLYLN